MNDDKVILYLKLSKLQQEFSLPVLMANPKLDQAFSQFIADHFLILNSEDDTWSINASNEVQ